MGEQYREGFSQVIYGWVEGIDAKSTKSFFPSTRHRPVFRLITTAPDSVRPSQNPSEHPPGFPNAHTPANANWAI